MGRPPSRVQDYLEWQNRLERFGTSDWDVGVFCLQEGVSRSSFYRWKKRLESGLADAVSCSEVEAEPTESMGSTFLPVSLKTPRLEIELPNGGVLRLPYEEAQPVLISIIQAVGSLRPWKAPSS